MKNIYRFLIVVFGFGMAVSCTNLEEDIYSYIAQDNFFTSEESVAIYAGRAYTSLQNWGSEQSWLTMDMLLGDEACAPINPEGAWNDEGRYKELQEHNVPSSSKLNLMTWDFIFNGIAACNDAIFAFENTEFEFDGKLRMISEVKVLRAFLYFLAADGYGKVPFCIDKMDKSYPKPKDRDFIYDWLETEITTNIEPLADSRDTYYYGRVTKGMANTLLTKLYLNAEAWGQEPQWEKAWMAAKEVIASGTYELADNYKDNFIVHNETSPEAILAIPYSTQYIESSDNAFCLFALTLSTTIAKKKYNIGDGWYGYVGQPDFIQSYEEGDTRLTDTYLFGQMYDKDGNKMTIRPKGSKEEVDYIIDPVFPAADFVNGRTELEGAFLHKWEYQDDGLLTSYKVSMENDIFIFRYADVILMYAEALLRDGQPLDDFAIEGLKKIRERAGLEPISDWDLDKLYLERSHEMALEGWRRQDMIRFGTYQDTWWAKSNTTPDDKVLLPIPSEISNANPNLRDL
ncbi:MAG: RagB/SusD family nutrient uptake outer membrane protein [Bacteroidales bacterium]|nr:RagB/SusD family nutrient uptake outer membrane protein [Bacteroidales bacterium]